MNSNSSQSAPLTPEQLERLPAYRQKWLGFACSTESIDQAIAIEAIQAMYRWGKLEPPEIEFCANPRELRERVEAYLERDPEWFQPTRYNSLYSCWREIRKRLDMPLSSTLQIGQELDHYLCQQLQSPLGKQLHRYWNAISHEIGLHWHRGIETRVWDLVKYPTWLISDGILFDFCVTELGHTWKEEDWLMELGYTCNQEQWQLMQTLASQVGWVVPLKQRCWVCDRPNKWVFDDSGELHGQTEPAIEYPGGFQVYAYHGLWLDDRFQQPPSQWKPTWVYLSPPDYRRMMIQEIGYERICQECRIKVVDTWQNQTLLWFPIRGGKQYLLKTVCETTGTSQYVEVPALTSAHAAVDWVNEQTREE
jgi:hypothetical protein